MILLLGLAFAQDRTVDPRINEEGLVEVLVVGESEVREAREEIIRTMKGLGYEERTRGDGTIVFKPPKAWMGRVRLSRDGLIDFGRPVVAFQGLGGPDPSTDPFDRTVPSGVGPQVSLTILPSKRKLAPVERRVLEEVWPDVRGYNDAIARRAFGESLYELPGRLDAVWGDGTPMTSGEPLPTPEARRGAVLVYWSGLPDTPQGIEASRTVETWLSEVVQPSPHPVTLDEQTAAEASRTDGRPLGLVQPPIEQQPSAP